MPIDDELDAFMGAEVQEGRRVREIRWSKLFLTVGVVFALVWLGADGLDELRYHFSGQELTHLGDAASVSKEDLAPGTYVRLSGVLGNKAATVTGLRPGAFRRGPYQVRQLLGSPVFVEFDQDALYERYQPFTRVTVEGRLVDFGPGGDLTAVRHYFQDRFQLGIPPGSRLLVVGEQPGALWRYPVIYLFFLVIGGLSVAFFVRTLRVQVVED